jgi:hypothetical protein
MLVNRRTFSAALIVGAPASFNPDLERFMAKRRGDKTIEEKASHASLISHPDVITGLLLEAPQR